MYSIPCGAAAQEVPHQHASAATTVALQPLALKVRQLETALNYLGHPLSLADHEAINAAIADPNEIHAVSQLQAILDQHVLFNVHINAEGRVRVEQGAARPELAEGGTSLFLVKVNNNARVTAPLKVESPNSGNVFVRSDFSAAPRMQFTAKNVLDRWANISLYQQSPMSSRLSGLAVEYAIVQIYSREAGQRAATISFNAGQGSQDIGFRNDVTVVFTAQPARIVTLSVKDENGAPTTASLIIRDSRGRLYPNPSKRLAPDLFFQPQIYRADREKIALPDGRYTLQYDGGPEYLPHTREFDVSAAGPAEIAIQLDRWIDPSRRGWYSGDHHVHAAGCAHYMNPSEGVEPKDMIRQISGEHLNVGSVLTWAPDYYYQKRFFSGKDDPVSEPNRHLLHYDLEISGFPSSHAGHLVLLGLKEQDFPGTNVIEDWPTWNLPIARWAKAQGAIVGYAHSGWGLQVISKDLPTSEVPAFDGVGANEFIVDVTHPNTVDFMSTVDTPYTWELNMWYHTLNVGFRPRIAGETDFPCIYDRRVGVGRTYVKLDGPLSYSSWLEGMRVGRSYVSDGKTHLLDLRANEASLGVNGSELHLRRPSTVTVTLSASAYLANLPAETMRSSLNLFAPSGDFAGRIPEAPKDDVRSRPYDQPPYWDLERARIGDSREVLVEIVMNGRAVAKQKLLADGHNRELRFQIPVKESSWIAARVTPASHTNPIFIMVDNKPLRPSTSSAQWCLNAVNQCWTQKAAQISPADLPAAKKAYDHAREVYRRLIDGAKQQ